MNTEQEKSSKSKEKTGVFNPFDFPRKRRRIHRWLFKKTGKWFKKRIDFEIVGLDNIIAGNQYIYCPNHQTHMDSLWTWHALGDKGPGTDCFGCMAKAEHLNTAWSRLWLTALGGIPVDRSGNPMHSFKSSVNFIREGNCFLVHPEGTRTRDGNLGDFKAGAALLSIKTGVPIIPVAIDGGCSVWSYDMTFPKTKDPVTGKKKKVRITFCKPVLPDVGTKEDITRMVREEIEEAIKEQLKGV